MLLVPYYVHDVIGNNTEACSICIKLIVIKQITWQQQITQCK